ncbi:competence protein ComEC [Lysinibacillus composti]|nr:competence protein ComEC [Lysinibacillus composti]
MIKFFTHKTLFYALSILVAAIAAHESVRLLMLLGLLVLYCIYRRIEIFHIISVSVLGLVAFFYFSILLKDLNKPLQLPTVLTWTGEYKINGSKLRGFMEDDEGRIVYVLYEFQSEEEKRFHQSIPLVGKQYVVEGVVVEPSKPPHKYAFSMENYLKGKGAKGILEISNWRFVKTKTSFSQRISSHRYKLIKHIESTFPQTLTAEAQALLIGYQEQVDHETSRAYQILGITHLFAISGLHIAIVSFMFFQGLLRLNVRREIATIVLIVILPIYAILAGGTPSVWRSVLMVELVVLIRYKSHLTVDDALCVSFICFVLLEPWSIYQVGFQLSYLATAALIFSSHIINRFSSWIVQSFFITFVCQLLVYPLLLFHFYEMSISSFMVNIPFVPLFSFIILPINILLLVLTFLPGPFASIMFWLYEPCRLFITKLIEVLQSLPYQLWNPGKPSLFLLAIAFVGVFITFYLLDIRDKWYKVVISLLLPILCLHFSGKAFNELKISFINVGQGDSILIELPFQKEVVLIDTGGLLRFQQEEWKMPSPPYEVGRQIVVPYLKGKGINVIDKLIITHADADHVEGAEEILKEIKVVEIHISPGSYKKEIMDDLITEAVKQQIPIKEQLSLNHWKVQNVTFQYVWPDETTYEGNNDSLGLYIKKGNFDALFTGDLEKEGEYELISKLPELKNIDLLKAGHHGSKTSSTEEFINQLNPSLTIFSAGENNRYGHPSKEVVERFNQLELSSLVTGEVGTIEIKVEEEQLKLETTYTRENQ